MKKGKKARKKNKSSFAALVGNVRPKGWCHVHANILEEDKVRVSYGLPVEDYIEEDARRNLFPNSNKRVFGGCIVFEDFKEATVLYCPRCRAAESEYRAAMEEQARERNQPKLRERRDAARLQLERACDRIPRPLKEKSGGSLASVEEFLSRDELESAFDELHIIGEENDCPVEFWEQMCLASESLFQSLGLV